MGRPETAPGGSLALKQERKTTMAQNDERTWTSYMTEVSEADFWTGVEDMAYAIDGERPGEEAALIDEFLGLPARLVLSEAERANDALLRRYAVVNLLQSFLRVASPERQRIMQRRREDRANDARLMQEARDADISWLTPDKGPEPARDADDLAWMSDPASLAKGTRP
jgi:hypothetical protein